MKRKIIIRQVRSKPPTSEQLWKLFGDMYRPDEKIHSSAQMKIVVRNSNRIYVLKNKEQE